MTIKTDWDALRADIETQVKGLLVELADGAITAVDGPIRQASVRLITAIQEKRPDLVDEIKDQLTVLFTTQKLRAKAKFSLVINNFISLGLNLLFNGAIAGLGAAKTI